MIAFRNGISDVINLDLLRLFNFKELQNLVSGCEDLIDVNDWKAFTVYTGKYSKNRIKIVSLTYIFGFIVGIYTPDHPVIQTFWDVVESLSEDQKRKLLKFSTSRSRPPLFGFKNLIPNFAILNSSSADRLPTASTCLNLLKLPPIEDFDTMREKLVCAIESESGFDLS